MKIYCIENKLNGKKYVGMTKGTIENRFKKHKYLAKKAIYKKQHIHNAMLKDGVSNFFVYELDTAINIVELKEKEIYWIKKLDTKNNGYNETFGGEGTYGYKLTDEHRSMLKEKAIKRFSNPENRKILSEKTKKWYENLSSDEKKKITEKLSNKLLGNTRAKGKKHIRSEEYCKKISESKKGIPRPEHVKKILSDKAKARVGWKHSPETIEKMRESAKKRKLKTESVGT